MSKIAIISQPEQGVLIDVGGCSTLHEATQHLTSTLQVSSQFWDGQDVDLNLGTLSLTPEQIGHVIAIMAERGVKPRHVFALSEVTKESLETHKIKPATGLPASLQADGTISGGTPQQGTISGASDKTEKSESGVVDCNPACDFTPADNSVDVRIESGDEHPGAESASESGSCSTGAESAEAGTAEKSAAAKGTDSSETDPPKVTAAPPVPHVLYLRQTLRSGQMISHKGHLVIVGDVNPGAEVMADGDITIWGALRGVAHAGIGGNTDSEIRALKFDPIQLRIANAIARSPDRPKVNLKTNGPETARIVNGIIRISSSAPE